MCRYLLAVPPSEEDTAHKVRLMYGNGLRPQIWKHFAERFKIKQIGEFYGATEGNSNLGNKFLQLVEMKGPILIQKCPKNKIWTKLV